MSIRRKGFVFYGSRTEAHQTKAHRRKTHRKVEK